MVTFFFLFASDFNFPTVFLKMYESVNGLLLYSGFLALSSAKSTWHYFLQNNKLTHRWNIAGNLEFRILPTSTCRTEKPGPGPPTFRLVDDPLYLLRSLRLKLPFCPVHQYYNHVHDSQQTDDWMAVLAIKMRSCSNMSPGGSVSWLQPSLQSL